VALAVVAVTVTVLTPPAPTLLRARCSCEWRRDTMRRLTLPTGLAATTLTGTTTTARSLTAAVAAPVRLLPLRRVHTWRLLPLRRVRTWRLPRLVMALEGVVAVALLVDTTLATTTSTTTSASTRTLTAAVVAAVRLLPLQRAHDACPAVAGHARGVRRGSGAFAATDAQLDSCSQARTHARGGWRWRWWWWR
jgi:hypothetical protein